MAVTVKPPEMDACCTPVLTVTVRRFGGAALLSVNVAVALVLLVTVTNPEVTFRTAADCYAVAETRLRRALYEVGVLGVDRDRDSGSWLRLAGTNRGDGRTVE